MRFSNSYNTTPKNDLGQGYSDWLWSMGLSTEHYKSSGTDTFTLLLFSKSSEALLVQHQLTGGVYPYPLTCSGRLCPAHACRCSQGYDQVFLKIQLFYYSEKLTSNSAVLLGFTGSALS